VVTIPTALIVIFSIYFFNLGIQNWFDKKVNHALTEAINIAHAYIKENVTSLKTIAISINDHLGFAYGQVLNNPDLLQQILNTQASLRAIDEAVIVQSSTHMLIARSTFSFSLVFTSIPLDAFEKAQSGEIVDISTPERIRVLIKLNKYPDMYLMIGRLVDHNIINYISATTGAVNSYQTLRDQILSLQMKFSIVFLVIALILIVVATSIGLIFVSKIIKPIRKLVHATTKIKKGNFNIHIFEGSNEDEIGILANSFNDMVKTLDKQRKELIIAQKTLAWSDMARMVAHEINNPLTPIRLATERLQKKYHRDILTAEEFNKYTDIILKHGSDIKKIVDDFVNFAKLSNPSLSKVDLISLIREAVESRGLLNEKKINYEVSFFAPSFVINCDKSQIRQVVLNILKNAEEATFNLPNPHIRVTILLENKIFRVFFQDNGPGFAQSIIDNVGQPYVTTKHKGTGLGLAVIKKILEQHNATFTIFNDQKEGGACVNIEFSVD
jgi:two-component system nitrogen regulation sensor histidine kinase NtrY